MTLLQTVISVALAVLVVTGGIQYVSPSAQTRAKLAAQIEAGFASLEGAYRGRQATEAPPPSADGWKATLFPAFGGRPVDVGALSWSYGNDGDGVWFCLSGPLKDDLTRTTLERLSSRYPAGLYDVTKSCGARGGPPETTVSATLWMQRAPE